MKPTTRKLINFLINIWFWLFKPKPTLSQSNNQGPNGDANIGQLWTDPTGKRWLIKHDGSRSEWLGSTFVKDPEDTTSTEK